MATDTTTRAEHLAWCKQRALEYVDRGELNEGFASMSSDLDKHPETANHAGSKLGIMMLLSGQLKTAPEMRRFIEGYN